MSDMTQQFFEGNRSVLAERLPGHLIVIAANSLLQSSADLHFPFRQDSNFWYLTGIDEPDAILVIDTVAGESTMLLPPKSTYQKEWDGDTDTDEFARVSGIVQFGSTRDLSGLLKQAAVSGRTVGYLQPLPRMVKPYGFYANPARRTLWSRIKRSGAQTADVRLDIARMRAIKQPEELAAIQEAIDITGRTLEHVKSRLAQCRNEKDIERLITARFFAEGGDGHAYQPIVAGGQNAATIHYVQNSAPLVASDLLLLDVGAVYQQYTSDISRTWSVGGSPTKRQRELYDAMCDVQTFAFGQLRAGVLLRDYQKTVEQYARTVCASLGIQLDAYPHGFSHFMGLDVHDAGDYSAPLQPGTVLTVEPGIYLAYEDIGIRIEDDVLITESGIDVLSKDIPKRL